MNLRGKKGSISIFVLVALLFMAGFLIISFASNINKSKTIKEQFNIISGIYSYTNGDEGAYNKAYTDLRNKNKQTMTASTENLEDTSTLELTKTFEDKVSNYRIYGNSIQDTTNGNPSPENPVEIQSVGDKKNLIKFNVYGHENITRVNNLEDLKNLISQGYDVIWSIHIQTSTGEILYNQSNNYYLVAEVEPNTEYSLSGYTKSAIYEFDDNFNYVQSLVKKDNSSSISFKTSEKAKYILTYIYNRAQSTTQQPYTLEEIKNMDQLEIGGTATNYVPYGKYGITLKISGKNKFNINNVKSSTYVTNNNDGTLTVTPPNASTTGVTAAKPNTLKDYAPDLEVGKTYILTGNSTISKKNYIYLNNSKTTWNFGTTRLITEEDLGSSVYWYGDFDDGKITSAKVSNIQIVEVGEDTTFQQYVEPVTTNIYLDEPLRKVGDVADYIDFKTGRVVRKCKKINVNGTEEWRKNNNRQDYDIITVRFFKIEDIASSKEIISDQYLYLPALWNSTASDSSWRIGSYNKSFYVSVDNSTVGITTEDTTDDRTQKLADYIKENNFYIIYPLVEQTEEDILLPELKTFEDYTKIEVLTNIAPSNIEVEYQGYTLD